MINELEQVSKLCLEFFLIRLYFKSLPTCTYLESNGVCQYFFLFFLKIYFSLLSKVQSVDVHYTEAIWTVDCNVLLMHFNFLAKNNLGQECVQNTGCAMTKCMNYADI